MNSIAWWANVVVLLVASGIDLRTRRIPNWLSVPFLIAGLTVPAIAGGWPGFRTSFAGFGLALLLFGLPCWLRAMGMGDLKLAAGVAAWIGPNQFWLAFIVTAIAGGIIAVAYAVRHPAKNRCPAGNGDPASHPATTGQPCRDGFGGTPALSIPYAPAIAIGTLFSFFAR